MHIPLPMGFYPFWFWNDALSIDEIRWQVKEMAEQGVRGFYIHSRQGLGQPYLSEAFFEMVDAAVAAAKERGLFVHSTLTWPILPCASFHMTSVVENGGTQCPRD